VRLICSLDHLRELGEEKRSEENIGVRVWRTLGHILEERRVTQGFEHVFLRKEGTS
jgi:hypothetical protein